MEMKDKYFALLLVVLGIFGLYALASTGIIKGVGAGAVAPAAAGAPVVISGTGGACPSTGTVDLPFYAQNSIADPTTGTKSGVMGTFSVYMAGTIVPYTSAVSTSSGSGATSSDLPCGTEGAFVILNSTTSYYPQRFDLATLPFAASGALTTRDLDQISTITLYGYNSSSTGTQTSTPLHQKLAASTTLSNLKYEIVSLGLKKIKKPLFGIKWEEKSSVDASANSTVSIPDTNWQVASCSLGGSGYDSYDDCWTYNGNVENGASLFVNPQITSASAFGEVNATAQVVDYGAYLDTAGTLLHEAYSNPSTNARPTYSGTAATFVTNFNG